MKKMTFVSVFGAMALIAAGIFAPAVYANEMGKMNQGMYQQSRPGMQLGAYRMKNLLGKDVKGMNGERLGVVNDFVIDPNGHVFALLATDNGRTIAVPFEAFSTTGTDNFLSLNTTRDQLASMSDYNQASFADRSWRDNMYRAFGLQPGWTYGQAQLQGQPRGMYQGRMASGMGYYDVSQLMGKDVLGANGQTIGTIRNFVIDPNGHVFALVSDSNTGRTVAVPFESFSSLGSDNTLSLNVTPDQLANAPEFSQASFAERSWRQNVYRFFGVQPYWSNQGMRSNRAMISSQTRQGYYQGQPFRMGNLLGKEVKGLRGETLGTINDFAISPGGRIFALISSADMRGKTVAVPFESFKSIGPDDTVSLNITKDQLASAPEFDQASFADRSWRDNVYHFFGIQPSWSSQEMSQSNY